MPTYEYRCPNGHDIERFFRKISDSTPTVECPECGKMAERIMSLGGGLLFKGSGFYLTDYGKNAHRGNAPPTSGEGGSKEAASPAPAAKEGSSTSSGGEAKSSGGESKASSESKSSTESKPAAKAESKPAASSSTTTKKDK